MASRVILNTLTDNYFGLITANGGVIGEQGRRGTFLGRPFRVHHANTFQTNLRPFINDNLRYTFASYLARGQNSPFLSTGRTDDLLNPLRTPYRSWQDDEECTRRGFCRITTTSGANFFNTACGTDNAPQGMVGNFTPGQIGDLVGVATGTYIFGGTYEPEVSYRAKEQLFELLSYRPNLRNRHTALDSFYLVNQTGNIGKLFSASQLVMDDSLSSTGAADSLCNSI